MNRKLRFVERQELLYDKGQATYEASAVRGTSAVDLHPTLLQEYADALGHPDPQRLLVARGLGTATGELTVAGLLLFASDPQQHLPNTQVRVLRYRGTDRGTGTRQQLLEDCRCEGLVNAVVHRSYSIGGDHVRIEIFDDRIEIESPGRFPGLVDPRDPLHATRFARNPRIARVCAGWRR